MAKGITIRAKKDLYLFGSDYRNRLYSREILANLRYGPSCVSLDYALYHHGLIPEQVQTLTSVTGKPSKAFVTPIGLFNYHASTSQFFHQDTERGMV